MPDEAAILPPLVADWPGLRIVSVVAAPAAPLRALALGHDARGPRVLETVDGGATWVARPFGGPLARDPGWWIGVGVWLATAWLLLGAAQRRYVGLLRTTGDVAAAWDELVALGPHSLADVWTGLGGILALVLWPSLLTLARRRGDARRWPPRAVEALTLHEGEPALLVVDRAGERRLLRLVDGRWELRPAPAP